jgi:Spy/CpxP family protein refolding chaperone
MFSRTKITLAGLALTLLTASAAGAQTQQPQSPTQNPTPGTDNQRRFGRGQEGRGMRKFGRGPLAGLRELNLSDEQQKQVRAIMERNVNNTKALREELRTLGQKRFEGTLTLEEQARAKDLHQQMAQSMKSAMTEVQGILTAEQKTRLEEFRQERGPRHGRRGRLGRPDQNQSNLPKP